MPSQSVYDVILSEGGFTFDVATSGLVRVGEASGYVVALPGTEMLLGPADLSREEFAVRFADLVADARVRGVFVGGWLSPERGFMIELSEVHQCSRAAAIRLGVQRNQEAILDLATGELISTGGSGDGAITTGATAA